MKISILGTYGIPNHHGGFERFAEELSVRLAIRGHDVTVYNPSVHPYREKKYKNVKIVTRSFPRVLGAAAPLIFDLLCVFHAMRSDTEVILQCGYTSSPWTAMFRNNSDKRLLTLMDGMEWQRTKWGWATWKFIKWTEKLAVRHSDVIIADHPVIWKYYNERYGADAKMLRYGVEEDTVNRTDAKGLGITELQSGYGLDLPGLENGFMLVIARIEPENNIEMILKGYLLSGVKQKMVVTGNWDTSLGRKLVRKYKEHPGIIFSGGIYDREVLKALRRNSLLYLHGHSAGGTNPSLLEAMAEGCNIVAHDNPFNKGVLGDFGNYFTTEQELCGFIQNPPGSTKREEMIKHTLDTYNWDRVVEEVEKIVAMR